MASSTSHPNETLGKAIALRKTTTGLKAATAAAPPGHPTNSIGGSSDGGHGLLLPQVRDSLQLNHRTHSGRSALLLPFESKSINKVCCGCVRRVNLYIWQFLVCSAIHHPPQKPRHSTFVFCAFPKPSDPTRTISPDPPYLNSGRLSRARQRLCLIVLFSYLITLLLSVRIYV